MICLSYQKTHIQPLPKRSSLDRKKKKIVKKRKEKDSQGGVPKQNTLAQSPESRPPPNNLTSEHPSTLQENKVPIKPLCVCVCVCVSLSLSLSCQISNQKQSRKNELKGIVKENTLVRGTFSVHRFVCPSFFPCFLFFFFSTHSSKTNKKNFATCKHPFTNEAESPTKKKLF